MYRNRGHNSQSVSKCLHFWGTRSFPPWSWYQGKLTQTLLENIIIIGWNWDLTDWLHIICIFFLASEWSYSVYSSEKSFQETLISLFSYSWNLFYSMVCAVSEYRKPPLRKLEPNSHSFTSYCGRWIPNEELKYFRCLEDLKVGVLTKLWKLCMERDACIEQLGFFLP